MKHLQNKKQLPTLLQAFDADNEHFALRVGKDRSRHSYNIKVRARQYVADYLQEWHHQSDISLEVLTCDFISDFSVYLTNCRQLRGGTVWLACMMLKGVVLRAYKRGLIRVNPFAEFHIAKNIRERQFLTEEELKPLVTHPFTEPALAYARDIFVFSALTGMSYIDIYHLRHSDIQKRNGHYWVIATRQKTGVPFRVRLFQLPLDIISRYSVAGKDTIFDRYGYFTVAKRLKTVMHECGITKPITLHCARHSFAIMALNHGMPIESISRILGHSNIGTTQIYARITMKKLDADFLQMEDRLYWLFTSKTPFFFNKRAQKLARSKKVSNFINKICYYFTKKHYLCKVKCLCVDKLLTK